jgi:hypothetical protein
VNLRIDEAETRALGVEGHVCELLLVHKQLCLGQVLTKSL